MACSTLRLKCAQVADPRAAEGDGDGGGGASGAKEQDALTGEFDAGLLAGHDHSAAVGIVAAEAGLIDHDGVHRPGDASSFVQLVQKRDHRPLVRHGDVETTEL
jgi:hypothetical protein